MKYLVRFCLFIIAGCHKNKEVPIPDLIGSMTVLKDCTGDYLRHEKKIT